MTHGQPQRTTRLLTPTRIAAALAAALAFAFVAVAAPTDANAKKADKTAKQVKKLNKQVKKANKQIQQLQTAVAGAVDLANQAMEQGGKVGPAGPAGPAGADGQNGEDGQDGANGAPGADGKSVLSGVGVPDDSLGSNGDFFIDTSTSEMYGPRSGGSWPLPPTSLKGADGPAGADGSPWVAGTAPDGAVLKGTWSIQQYTAAGVDDPVPVPLSTGVPVPGDMVINAQVVPPGPADPSNAFGCTGTAAAPTPSTLTLPANITIACVYQQAAVNLKAGVAAVTSNDSVGSSGGGVVARIRTVGAGATSGYGSWALKVN